MGAGGPSVQKLFDHCAKHVGNWKYYFYVTDRYPVYPLFIPDVNQIICKTYLTTVEGKNRRLRHYLARVHRQTHGVF